ncbi:hypothetical protein JTB14_008119 [Gonioctena quinquepunctata]|nr:hypothetical protein JTB14_008119 [Gonioctena quinquepunctata]
MARRMHPNRLIQDELTYELRIRGIATGTVNEIRHALSMVLRLEKSGDSVSYPKYPFTLEEHVKAIKDKLAEVEPLAFDDSLTSNAFFELQSKLSHVLNRIDHIEGEEAADRPVLLAKAQSLLETLYTKAESYQTDVPPQLTILNQTQFAQNIPPQRRSSGISPTRSPTSSMKQILPNDGILNFLGIKRDFL